MKHQWLLLFVLFSFTAHSQTTSSPAVPSATAVSNGLENLKINLPVIKYKLKNGLTVLLLVDSTVPMISYHTWYRVGSRDEAEGVTGAAHMLEHMMFKGSEKYPHKDFDRLMQENGILSNAFTSYDYTGFHQSLPSSKLEMMMQIEVDRMAHLTLNPEDLLSERDVVKEERRWRVDNNPMSLLQELTMSTVFKVHPYRWPVIGTMKDISNFNVETLRHFHETYYSPSNAVLVLVGDFRVSEARRLIEKYYGGLPMKAVPERKIPLEPPQKSQKNATLKADVQGFNFMVSYQGVPQGHADMYPLDLAAHLLGNGPSSRLSKRLVYQSQKSTSATSWHSNMIDHGIFAVAVGMKPGEPMEKALDVVYNEMFKLRQQPVSEEELQKAKTLAMKSLVDSLVSNDGKAQMLAASELLTGSYENLLTDLVKYNSVTSADIQRVAQKYFNQNQRSVVVLAPKKAGL